MMDTKFLPEGDIPTIAFVDHSEEDLKQLIDRLGKFYFPDSMDKLRQRYRFVPIVIEENEEVDWLVKSAMAKLDACRPGPDIVLVDLSFGERVRRPVTIGASLASTLQKMLPVPVGVYTRWGLKPEQRVEIAMHRFDVVFDRTFSETSVTLASQYDKFFKRILEHQKANPDIPYDRPVPADCRHLHVEWESGHPTTRSQVLQIVGPKVTKLALRKLYTADANMSISQLSGGFSGSYVLKVSVLGENRKFILKIDEDPTRLQRELQGLRAVVRSVNEKYYVTTIPAISPEVCSLWRGWWGALPLSFLEDAKPLISHDQLSAKQLAEIYTDLWRHPLADLYGQAEDREMIAEEVLAESNFSSASTAIQSVDRYLQLLRRNLDAAALADLDAGVDAIKERRPRNHPAVGSRWARAVHGDLNCRNILLNTLSNSYQLIDFPNVQPNWITTDFVKAEAELVLIIMDWNSGRDCDLYRVGEWAGLTRLFALEHNPQAMSFADTELQRIGMALAAIRGMYVEFARGLERAYSINLFSVVIRYLSYPDITVAKRALALCWLGQLADSLVSSKAQ